MRGCILEDGTDYQDVRILLLGLKSICTWSGPAFSLRSVLGTGAVGDSDELTCGWYIRLKIM